MKRANNICDFLFYAIIISMINMVSFSAFAETETVVDKSKVIESILKLKKKNKSDSYKKMIHLLVKKRLAPVESEKSLINAFGSSESDLKAILEKSIDVYLPQKKVNQGEVCNLAQCSSSSVCKPSLKKSKSTALAAGSACQFHSDCQSQNCLGLGEKNKTSGKCDKPKKCFKGIAANKYCSRKFDLCLKPNKCREIKRLSFNIGECRHNKKRCSENTDCCSNFCYKGKCARNFRCQNCAEKGQRVTGSQDCCDGLYPDQRNRCRQVSPL